MTEAIVKEQTTKSCGKGQAVINKLNVEDADKANVKHEQFLALLKKQYGYTNDKAVGELERLLKLFYTMNRSLGIRRAHVNIKHPPVVA